jgi:catechol 2,3-dioxygenase-like lactoylglutathione lyase family enzyme
MFDHVSIGVHDLARAKRFYDATLHPLGYVCLSENVDALGYGRDKIGLWIGKAPRPVPSDTIKPPLLLCRAHT